MRTRLTPWPSSRNLITTVLATLAVALLLAACGPAPGAGREDQPAEAPGPSPTAGSATEALVTGQDGSDVSTLPERDEAGADPDIASDNARPTVTVQPGSEEVDARGVPVGFTTEGYAFRGDPDAPVVMEEYSDFQCPYCERFFEQTLPSLESNQIAEGEVVLVFRDFPLTRIHPQAQAAHQAAYCAGEEGAAAFWEMHDTLFERSDEWAGKSNTTEIFTDYADSLDLDVDAFAGCVEGGRFDDHIQAGLQAGMQRGVNSTPSFFINGQPLTGAQPLSVFNDAIATVQAGGELASQQPQEPQQQQPAVAPTPASVSDDYAATIGDPDAPVTIVEFTDYECPYCSRHSEQTFPSLLEQFIETGEVFYVLKDMPLENIHPQAKSAAAAARCAGDQDAYWEMHDALFSKQPLWAEEGDGSRQVFVELAGELGLNSDQFESCLDSGRYDQAIEANLAEGRDLGITGTPFFFIDGYPIPGAQPIDLFAFAIDRARQGTLAEAYTQQQEPTPEPQPQQPVDVPLGDAPSVGDADAPVVIVEYTDFQCPYCARHHAQTYPQILENMVETGRVRYVFKDFPLTSIHPQAVLAAEAARCAREQEAYLEMHDALFENQGDWNGKSNAAELFTGYAGELGLDTDAFASCLDSHRHQDAVMAELEEGTRLGVRGTPGFFINGYHVSGAQPYEVFEQAVTQLSAEGQ